MASHLACLGFAEDTPEAFAGLAQRLLPDAVAIGSRGRVSLVRWQDVSGARLTFAVRSGSVDDVLLSLASDPGAILRDATIVERFTLRADVVDDTGEQVTALVAALDVGPLLAAPYTGPASVTALGERITVHPDAESFHASAESRFRVAAAEGERKPGSAQGTPNVSGFAAESFLSYGIFGSIAGDGSPTPHALLHGTVLAAERRRNVGGGASFVIARVRTAGFIADVCFPATEHAVPEVGSVVGGDVYLVGTIPAVPRTVSEAPQSDVTSILQRLRRVATRSRST